MSGFDSPIGWMMMFRVPGRLPSCFIVFPLLCSLIIVAEPALGQVTSKNNDRLRRILERYPNADLDGDGILTAGELKLAIQKVREGDTGGRRKGSRPATRPTHQDIKYGPHKRNRLDLWLAPNVQRAPLVVFIHGGGFQRGDKSSFRNRSDLIRLLNRSGISVSAINYRLTEGGKHPYPAPMHDAARAIQFLRYNAEKYRLDKQKFAAMGSSAGGCISLWLAFHDDLADQTSDDPVLRESTRLIAAAPINGQSCLHKKTLLQWFGVTSLKQHSGGGALFAVNGSVPKSSTKEIEQLTWDASPISHLSKDDPPCYMVYPKNRRVTEQSEAGLWVHHPIMGLELRKRMRPLGLSCYLEIDGDPPKAYRSQAEFLVEMLGSRH